MQELIGTLYVAIDLLKQATSNLISLTAGCDLFLRLSVSLSLSRSDVLMAWKKRRQTVNKWIVVDFGLKFGLRKFDDAPISGFGLIRRSQTLAREPRPPVCCGITLDLRGESGKLRRQIY